MAKGFLGRSHRGRAIVFSLVLVPLSAGPAAAAGSHRYMSTYVFCQRGSETSWGADAYSDKREGHLDLVLSGFNGDKWFTLEDVRYDRYTGTRGNFFVMQIRKGRNFGDRYQRYRVTGKLTRGNNSTSDAEEC